MFKLVSALTSAASALAAALFFLGIPGRVESGWSFANRADILRNQIAALRRQNDRVEAFQKKRLEYNLEARELRKRIRELDSIIPDDPKINRLKSMLDQEAKRAGVSVRASAARSPIAHDFYSEISIPITVAGPYHSVANFFRGLAGMERIVDVSNVSLRLPADKPAVPFRIRANQPLEAPCMVTAYFLRPATASRPQAPPAGASLRPAP